MKKSTLRRILCSIAAGTLMTALVYALIAGFFQNIGELLKRTEQTSEYAVIFEQLKHADLKIPLLLTEGFCLVAAFLCCWILCGHPKKSRGRILLAVILGVGLFLAILGLTLWFTKVNDLQFGIVLKLLYGVLQSGIW